MRRTPASHSMPRLTVAPNYFPPRRPPCTAPRLQPRGGRLGAPGAPRWHSPRQLVRQSIQCARLSYAPTQVDAKMIFGPLCRLDCVRPAPLACVGPGHLGCAGPGRPAFVSTGHLACPRLGYLACVRPGHRSCAGLGFVPCAERNVLPLVFLFWSSVE